MKIEVLYASQGHQRCPFISRNQRVTLHTQNSFFISTNSISLGSLCYRRYPLSPYTQAKPSDLHTLLFHGHWRLMDVEVILDTTTKGLIAYTDFHIFRDNRNIHVLIL